MKNFIYAAFAAISLFTFSSCRRDHLEDPTGTTGSLELEMEHMFGTSAFQVTTPFTDANGDTVIFSSGNYWISHVRFIKTDGSFYETAVNHKINLSIPNTATTSIANIPNGDYTGVQLAIGTDTSAVFGAFSGSVANVGFDYSAFGTGGPAYSAVFDFGTILSISPNAAPIIHMSMNLESLFANGITPALMDTILVGTYESETLLLNMLSSISFEHLHQ